MSAFTTRPELRGNFGMVASTHWLASSAGMAMLERGGNAFDAAVAAGFVLQVVEPHLNGPGGEVPIVIYDQNVRRAEVICGQGPAPAGATIEAFEQLGLGLIPGNGMLPACVPGSFGAWLALLRDHGTMRLSEVMEPAITYARDGYPVVPGISAAIAGAEMLFAEQWPTSAEVYLPVPAPGTVGRNPALAGTYERVVAEAESPGPREVQIARASDAFYEGWVAEAIGDFYERTRVLDVTGTAHAGFLRADDLAGWRPPVEAPVTTDYAGLTIAKTGPWGQGPVFLQQLALLTGFDLAAMGHNSADWIHTIVECAKLAFADREAFYGDPEFADVPLAALLSATYANERRALVTKGASTRLRPGSPDGRTPSLPAFAAGGATGAGLGDPTLSAGPSDGDTCHVDVVDRWGNFVAATPSGGWLQSAPVIPQLGFCLGTRAQMFVLDDDHPNSLAPGKRPRTTLTPTLVLRGDDPVLAFGTPGGDMQDQWSLNFFLAHVHGGLDLQAAIDAPMFHTEHFPSSFYPRASRPGSLIVEGRLQQATVTALEKRGHEMTIAGDWSLGRLSAVGRDAATGLLAGAANARGMQGYAVGR